MEQKTFFNWFTDHGDPSADDIAEVIWLTCEIQQYQYVGDRPLHEVYLIYLYILFWELALFPSYGDLFHSCTGRWHINSNTTTIPIVIKGLWKYIQILWAYKVK
jgi:hypothetical protein